MISAVDGPTARPPLTGTRSPLGIAPMARVTMAPPVTSSARRDRDVISRHWVMGLSPLKLGRHQQQRQPLLARFGTADRLARLRRGGLSRDRLEQLGRIEEVLDPGRDRR